MPLSTAFAEHRVVASIRSMRQHRVAAYLCAAGAVALATVARWALREQLGDALPFVTYFPAVILAALFGMRVGPAAALTSAAVVWLLFLHVPDGSPARELIWLSLFLLAAAAVVGVVGLLGFTVDRLVAQERNIRTILEAAPNGILVVDEQGKITMVNPAMEKLFGYNRTELIGRSVDALLPSESARRHEQLRQEYMYRPEPRPMGAGRDLSGKRSDGTEVPVEIGLAPVARNGRKGVLATVVDITERKRGQERERLLLAEMRHRAQNVLAVVQAIALRSFSENKTVAELKTDFLGRLRALARSNALLGESGWERAPLGEVLAREFGVFSKRLAISGCEVVVNPTAARQFAMIIHELATNAAKHGALSTPEGLVTIEGDVEIVGGKRQFVFRWREEGGPPVSSPVRKGFGTEILTVAARQVAQEVRLEFQRGGLRYELRAALSEIVADPTRIEERPNVA